MYLDEEPDGFQGYGGLLTRGGSTNISVGLDRHTASKSRERMLSGAIRDNLLIIKHNYKHTMT